MEGTPGCGRRAISNPRQIIGEQRHTRLGDPRCFPHMTTQAGGQLSRMAGDRPGEPPVLNGMNRVLRQGGWGRAVTLCKTPDPLQDTSGPVIGWDDRATRERSRRQGARSISSCPAHR